MDGLSSGGSSSGREASAASQPAMEAGARGTTDAGLGCWRKKRLKKHYGRWMDIVRSLELESFILTKLTKPSVPVNLVGSQVSLPLY